jgi:hypothetical protein
MVDVKGKSVVAARQGFGDSCGRALTIGQLSE